MRTIGTLFAVAVSMWLLGCANLATSTETRIEQGEARLLPETVVVGSDAPSAITALVLIKGERKGIAILSSECKDGVGSIRVFEETGEKGFRQVSAFARGESPPDKLFATVCEIGLRQMLQKPRNSP